MADEQDEQDVEAAGELSLPRYFPPPSSATEHGVVQVGGELRPDVLLDAYRHGIFPWPEVVDDWLSIVLWCSPEPRAIIELGGFHVSRRLARTVREGRFEASCDRDFEGVIRGCAAGTGRQGGTWLTPAMIETYCQMHALGHAHSVEVWHGSKLAGGTYGLAIGGLFAAESMFYRVRDASKVALAYLVAHLRRGGTNSSTFSNGHRTRRSLGRWRFREMTTCAGWQAWLIYRSRLERSCRGIRWGGKPATHCVAANLLRRTCGVNCRGGGGWK